jgi:plasmid stabilization system protein ParE
MPQLSILWSDKAKRTYADIIEYLNIRWTKKEIHHFIFRTDTLIEKITNNPCLFKQHKNDPLIREAVLHGNVILIYKIPADSKTITLITFWGTRQNPKKLKVKKE